MSDLKRVFYVFYLLLFCLSSVFATENYKCWRRDRTALPDKVFKPYDSSDFDAGAGEFPWQGAIFTKSGSFLCGCYVTEFNTCTTTASCVKNYEPSELKIAVEIYDIANLEGDKNAQISGCDAIAYNPKYDVASGKYDIAKLHLTKKLRYKPICIDEYETIPFFSYDDCVVTGWGDSNTLHYVDVELLSEAQCENTVPDFDPLAMACGKVNHDVCKLVEFGGGLQCRDTGERNRISIDEYLLKGTYSGVNCTTNIITFSRIDFEWFNDAFFSPPVTVKKL